MLARLIYRRCSEPSSRKPAKRLRREPLFAEDPYTAEDLVRRIDALDRQANQATEWLHEMIGLVEPEPSMRGAVNA